jgi:hypothetical protein
MCGGVAAQHFKDSLFNSLVHHGVNVYGRYHIGFNKAPPPAPASFGMGDVRSYIIKFKIGENI